MLGEVPFRKDAGAEIVKPPVTGTSRVGETALLPQHRVEEPRLRRRLPATQIDTPEDVLAPGEHPLTPPRARQRADVRGDRVRQKWHTDLDPRCHAQLVERMQMTVGQ